MLRLQRSKDKRAEQRVVDDNQADALWILETAGNESMG